MIDQLVAALGQELGLTSKEIADTVWLALRMESSGLSAAIARKATDGEADAKPNRDQSYNRDALTSGSDSEPEKPSQEAQPTAELHTPNSQSDNRDGLGSELMLKVPDARSLREPLSLAKSLKPLLRKVTAGWSTKLDEAATVERIADEGIWMPVLQPALEPWLDLALVVDESISMYLWQHTLTELQRLLANYGVFRDVRVWSLVTDDGGQVKLRPRLGAAARRQTLHRPSELIDAGGRRLILIATDCVSAIWQDGTVLPALKLWAASGPMAIMQMLPEWLWARTGLGFASAVRLHALMPGVPNQQLDVRDLSPWDEVDLDAGVQMPVVTLEPGPFLGWAKMVSAKEGAWTPGFVFESDGATSIDTGQLWNASSEDSAEQRVQTFRATASPMARRLAGLIAAAPVISLPVVRIIRERLLSQSKQIHTAEVFLSGLLKPESDICEGNDPDEINYEFFIGVRSLLLDSLPTDDSLDVVNEVSEYVAERIGISLSEFSAALIEPERAKSMGVEAQLNSFAWVTAEILEKLGGRYAQVARKLRHSTKALTSSITSSELLKNIYNSFDPFQPLQAGDPKYVDCSEVRGEENILMDVGRQITLSDRITHQLYTGHRGAGKSTELLRLQAHLEELGYKVVYFAAEKSDIDPEDAQYTDILLACTRNLLKGLRGDQTQIQQWLQSRKEELVDAMQSEVGFDSANVNAEMPFAKLTTTLKVRPTARSQIRKIVKLHTPSLIDALNAFIQEAMAQTDQVTTEKLVLIVDSLDRILPILREKEPSNHEQIFIDNSEWLKMLGCHVIYTVPISLIYSERGRDAMNIYDGYIGVLPMVMVRHQNGDVWEAGLAAMRQLFSERVFHAAGVDAGMALVGDIFDEQETLDQLCLMSGGHMRNLMLMAQEAIKNTDTLPITKKAVRLAITKARTSYRNAVYDSQWSILARVHQTKELLNDEAHRELLFNRCILEYRYIDEEGEILCWRDIHPLLLGTKEFKVALARLEEM